MITSEEQRVIRVFKNRWRTLMSVDDLIAETVNVVENELGLGDNTYYFTPHHGFQLGQVRITLTDTHRQAKRKQKTVEYFNGQTPCVRLEHTTIFSFEDRPSCLDNIKAPITLILLLPLWTWHVMIVATREQVYVLEVHRWRKRARTFRWAQHLTLARQENVVDSWRDEVFIDYYTMIRM